MDRLFLDANVLFSAAYKPVSGILRIWKLKRVQLLSSRYAVEEARFNLLEESQKKRLSLLVRHLILVDATSEELPAEVDLPEKDRPILLAAIEARATHLLTGDLRHFGVYLGKRCQGVLIQLPGEYLRTISDQ